MTICRRATVLLLSLLSNIGLAGQVYSWKDASGKAHYSDRPPLEQQADSRKLAAPPATTADVETAQKTAAEREMAEREKQQKTQEATKKTKESQAQAQQREENCRQAKANLAAIESGLVRYALDAKGERVALDGAVRDAELGKARKSAESWCNPAKSTGK